MSPKEKAKLLEPVLKKPKGNGRQYVEVSRPAAVTKAFDMRANGESFQMIGKETGLDRNVLRRLFRTNPEVLEKMKKAAAMDHLLIAEQYNEAQFIKVQRLLEDPEKLDELDPQRLALAAGIHTDKALTLSGTANVIIEHRKGLTLEDAQRAINEAREKIKQAAVTVEAEIINDPVAAASDTDSSD